MNAPKQLRSLVLGSITCDIMLCKGSVSDIHEAVSHLCGHPVWTHELTLYADDASSEILRQFPDFPSGRPENWEERAREIVERFGEFMEVRAGTGERDAGPMETLQAIYPQAHVIVVDPSNGGAA